MGLEDKLLNTRMELPHCVNDFEVCSLVATLHVPHVFQSKYDKFLLKKHNFLLSNIHIHEKLANSVNTTLFFLCICL